MKKTVRLQGVALRKAVEPLIEYLGKADRERLAALCDLATGDSIGLAAAMEKLFPGQPEAAAQSNLRGFRKRFNDQAKELSLRLRFDTDTEKRSTASERVCWFSGDDPLIQNATIFSAQSTADIEGDPLVRPQVIATTARALADAQSLSAGLKMTAEGKLLVRIFVSYSHDDHAEVEDLVRRLKRQFGASKYQIEPWIDRNTGSGQEWHDEIATNLRGCDFGLLMLSPAFLGSAYILRHELPLFVPANAETKPFSPVGLKLLDFKEQNLRGIEKHQIFRHRRKGDQEGDFYSAFISDVERDTFAHFLFLDLKKRWDKEFGPAVLPLAKLRAAADGKARGKKEKQVLAAPDSDICPPQSSCASPSSRYFDREFHLLAADSVKHIQRTRAVPADLNQLERISAEARLGEPVDALRELEAWAKADDANVQPFCAVLGEYGVGKTTTLKWFTRDLLERREKGETLPQPIYIDLRLQLGSPTSVPMLRDLLEEVIRRNTRLTEEARLTADEILRLVREEGAILIFDGIDEKIVHLPPAEARAFIRELCGALPPVERKAAKTEAAGQPAKRRGKVILSCRSHYFRDATSQSAMLVGEDREGIRRTDYRVFLMLPFTEDQILGYLGGVLGTPERAKEAMALIRSIHNLRDLATRPVLLAHITEHLTELERLKLAGEPVNAARLYDLVVTRWLARDDGKHQIEAPHKRLLMERLAAKLAADGEREMDADALESWLDEFLHAEPAIAGAYANRSRAVLKEDLRTATFVVRPEAGANSGRFRFAHTSLQEFFVAAHLYRALREGRADRWNLPPVSDETLEFLGQMLLNRAEPAALRTWEAILGGECLPAALLAFRLWLKAIPRGWPEPKPAKVCLANADLAEWEIRGHSASRPLDLRGANLTGADLSRARLCRVDLSDATLAGMVARQAIFEEVSAARSNLARADLSGLSWRQGSCEGVIADSANLHGTEWINVNLSGSVMPERFDSTAEVCASHDNGVFSAKLESAGPWTRTGHSHWVSSCAFSPDGRLVLSGSWDNTLRLWDGESGRELRRFEGHSSAVSSCAFSPDGRLVLSGSSDNTLRLWDAESGQNRLICAYLPRRESAVIDPIEKRFRYASAGAWEYLGWQYEDPVQKRLRILPAEYFGPLPG